MLSTIGTVVGGAFDFAARLLFKVVLATVLIVFAIVAIISGFAALLAR